MNMKKKLNDMPLPMFVDGKKLNCSSMEVRTAKDEMSWEFVFRNDELEFIVKPTKDGDGYYVTAPTPSSIAAIKDWLRAHPEVIELGAVGGRYTIVPDEDSEIEFWALPIDQLH